jgi:hypothetical protein
MWVNLDRLTMRTVRLLNPQLRKSERVLQIEAKGKKQSSACDELL